LLMSIRRMKMIDTWSWIIKIPRQLVFQ